MIRVFTAAPLFLIAVAPAGAQYLHHYNIGPPNPQQVIMEQRYQDAISRNAANRLLDQMSPPRPMIDPGVRYGSGTVIVVPDVSTRRLRASQSKRQVSARGSANLLNIRLFKASADACSSSFNASARARRRRAAECRPRRRLGDQLSPALFRLPDTIVQALQLPLVPLLAPSFVPLAVEVTHHLVNPPHILRVVAVAVAEALLGLTGPSFLPAPPRVVVEGELCERTRRRGTQEPPRASKLCAW